MRDILIPGKVIRREIIIAAVALAAAFLLNVYSILKYKTAWTELFSQLHVVIAVAVVIYLLVLIFRLLFLLIFRVSNKK